MQTYGKCVYVYGGHVTAPYIPLPPELPPLFSPRYRDARLPSASIIKRPKSRTPDEWFVFSANKPGCYFEYRIWDPYNYLVCGMVLYGVDIDMCIVMSMGMGWYGYAVLCKRCCTVCVCATFVCMYAYTINMSSV
ncbi:hypothetical protein EON63_23355 [archaeon]|nr:MAG: hypothetical protein EON63_23355 [archaeon]